LRPNTFRYRHLRADVPDHPNSLALLSTASASDVKRAVFFIHGYSGSARDTWADFISLVDDAQYSSDWWQNSDLFFYDYYRPSVFSRVSKSATALFSFLDELFPTPRADLFTGAFKTLRDKFQYDEVVLVGHSEGGLLIRNAILKAAGKDQRLDAYHYDKTLPQPQPEGLLKAQLRLFAPAIAGESITGLLGFISRLPVIEPALNSFSPAKKGLASGSSPVALARTYTDNKANELSMECFKAHILWAEDDKIVDDIKYERDVECTAIRKPKSSHTSVCKPTTDYLMPIGFVEKGIHCGCK
jgi:pimeloyl-ACP methyl ester carboxylesterase